MGLTTKSSPILGAGNHEAAQALMLLARSASEVIPTESTTTEEKGKAALLTSTNDHSNLISSSKPIQKPLQQHIKMEIENRSPASTSHFTAQKSLIQDDKKYEVSRKRRHSYNSLEDDIRKSVLRNCKKIFANATEDTLPYLREELDRFISELYSKGICDEELANRRKKKAAIAHVSHSRIGFFDESSEDENRNTKEVRKNISSVLSSRGPGGDTLVPIGDGYAKVQARLLRHMNWSSYTACTRKLLTAVFSRDILATHSLTGKSSPAFPDKPAKKKLDQRLVNDIIKTIVYRCNVSESQVRTSITTKCADESKMFRTREQKENKGKGRGKKTCSKVPLSTSESDD